MYLLFKAEIKTMKHLLKKISLIGAGGVPSTPPPPPPPPAKLTPPKIGIYNPHSSYSHAEIIDLISDGPIEALVNSYGKSLPNSEIFQGIYLDDAPIAQSTFTQSNQGEIFNDYVDTATIMKDFANGVNKNTKMTKSSGFLSKLWNISWDPGADFAVVKWAGGFANEISFLNNNQNTLSVAVTTALVWADTFYFLNIDVESPNLRSSGWVKQNTDFSANDVSAGTLWPSKLHYYKKNNAELHTLGTQGLTGTVVNALNQFNSIKDNASINQYEREIIKKKIAKIESFYKNNKPGKRFFQASSETRYIPSETASGWNKTAPSPFNIMHSNQCFLVIPITTTFNKTSLVSIGLKPGSNTSAVENGKLLNFNFYLKDSEISSENFFDCIVPEINDQNQFTGRVYGFIAIKIDTQTGNSLFYTNFQKTVNIGYFTYTNFFDIKPGNSIYVDNNTLNQTYLNNLLKTSSLSFSRQALTSTTVVKYNYNNILSEIKYGTNNQKPLAFFSKLYLDKPYKQKLIGPFRATGQVRRFSEISNLLNPTSKTSPSLVGGTPNLAGGTNVEGSLDSNRASEKGSYTEANQTFDENAIAFTHVVENPETVSAIVSITINELTDTLTKTTDIDGNTPNTDGSNPNLEAPGTKIPAVVNIRIETGKQKNNEILEPKTYDYSIYGIIANAATIDFGNPENDITKYNFISTPANQSINTPFLLPTLSSTEINSDIKRYIRVYKISTETYSVLLRREVFIDKVTEIVNSKFSYPFCAIVGSKIDARSLSSIPIRSFDCRLKKVKIPHNYHIMENGYDIRYQKSKTTYETSGRKRIYHGDWNGGFKIGWTDNPAWILYDILINKRYGLGQYFDESQINIWDLYKIGRYCDAVDDDGYFIGVSDGRGGLEPRFSCNVLFNSSTKLFDAINIISNLFRGSVFFSRSEINFVDDRPKEPTALFNNTNVKDGFFNYITNKKDDIFNTVEVAYLDRFDNFKTKIELIEDFEDIRQRGPLKTVVNTIGVTSKSMAKRIGRHVIWQTTKENEAIEFTAGLESLLCKPGDLIIVDDELRTRNINCGRILDIDVENRRLTLSNQYDDVNFDGYIEIYTPTGFDTRKELELKASLSKSRMDFFTIKPQTTNQTINLITGSYRFSSYDINNTAIYSGYNSTLKQKTFCYYDDDKKGWIFSTGFLNKSTSLYDKVICYTNSTSVDAIDDYPKYLFVETSDSTTPGQSAIFNGIMIDPLTQGNMINGGIYDNEIIIESPRQITKYQISGVTTNINDGSIVYLHPNNFNLNLLTVVQPGSSYRIGIKSRLNQIYKVISIREQEQNEYFVVATKYDSGKWSAIENDNVIENPQQVFYDSSNLNKRITSLGTPTNLFLDIINEDADTFDITGTFNSSHNNFKITVENKAVGFLFETTTSSKAFGIENLNDLGRYDLTVQAISTNSSNLNSYPAKTHKFIGYQKTDQNQFDRPYVETFTII